MSNNQKITILVVEDEGPIRKRIARVLSGEGFRVSEANKPDLARDLFDKIKPEIILMDINLCDDVDGIQLAQEFRESGHRFLLGYLTQENDRRIDARQSNAKFYFRKPIEFEKLADMVFFHYENFVEEEENSEIILTARTAVVKINPKNIIYVRAKGSASFIKMKGLVELMELPSTKLGELEELIGTRLKTFIRVHNSWAINSEYFLEKVRKVYPPKIILNADYLNDEGSDFFQEFGRKAEVPIGRKYLSEVRDKLGI